MVRASEVQPDGELAVVPAKLLTEEITWLRILPAHQTLDREQRVGLARIVRPEQDQRASETDPHIHTVLTSHKGELALPAKNIEHGHTICGDELRRPSPTARVSSGQ